MRTSGDQLSPGAADLGCTRSGNPLQLSLAALTAPVMFPKSCAPFRKGMSGGPQIKRGHS